MAQHGGLCSNNNNKCFANSPLDVVASAMHFATLSIRPSRRRPQFAISPLRHFVPRYLITLIAKNV